MQLQVNYLDWEDDQVQSRRCCEVARAHGVDVIVLMEPVKGGMLGQLPEKVGRAAARAAPGLVGRPLGARASACRWTGIQHDPERHVRAGATCSGQPPHLRRTSSRWAKAERAAIAEAVAILNSMPSIPCTGCSYCVDNCPQHINIPGVFEAGTRIDALRPACPPLTGHYEWILSSGSGRASDCISLPRLRGATARSTWRSPASWPTAPRCWTGK